MIIKGGSRKSGAFFASHLMKTEDNERVSIAEMKGLYADDLPEAFREMRLIAAGTRAENYFYHVSINPREDERLSPEQWEFAVDRLEHNLGLDGHARFQVEHEKEGRTHRHIVWSRVDPDTMTVTSDSFTYLAHDQTRAELEQEFHHELTPPTPQPSQRKSREIPDWENFRAQESGIDPKEVKAEVTQLWKQSDSGPAFIAALEDAGYTLCQGDRGYCIIDSYGDSHSLVRRLDGIKTAELREYLSGIPLADLPTVAEASQQVRQRNDNEEEGSTGAVPVHTTQPADEEPITQQLTPARSIEDLIPPTHPPADSAEKHADLTEAVMRSTQAELPHSRHTWQDWAAQAWDTLRMRAGELAERVKGSASSFWQDLVKDQLPPAGANEEQSAGHWRQLFGKREPPDDIIHKEPELER
jgi:hypothetical protein